MSIQILREIICDKCGEHCDSSGRSAKEARDLAAECNWQRIKKRGKWKDLCPRCAADGTLKAWDYQ